MAAVAAEVGEVMIDSINRMMWRLVAHEVLHSLRGAAGGKERRIRAALSVSAVGFIAGRIKSRWTKGHAGEGGGLSEG